ncbi:hypothetical protein [Salaquimonas pukyongi]|uniref:hypothetical protein n=1 Tax=Salaquimonas pukyongi TaxID=2712698 RepID=UPI0012EC8F31|nr:hypothetical protein [Salaquimonas pukyongi]
MITKVTYRYRDASNYKFWGEFHVSGKFSLEMVEDCLFDGEFFVPHEVGLPHLLNLPMNEDDHYLHTLEKFEAVSSGEPICSADELAERFKSAHRNGWFSSFTNKLW